MKTNSNHTTLNKLRENNRIWFNNAKFHEDKAYELDEYRNILTVTTGHGKARYEWDNNYKLSYLRD